MNDQQRFLNKDLVLKVSGSLDLGLFDPSKYESFLEALCAGREYQKVAILTTLRYLLGGKYQNLRSLAQENFEASVSLKERYGSFKEMERHLQLPEMLSCSLDLATGTGKSYVMYGIARIMLACGAVDRVLVLVPSTTIERELTEKFRELSSDTMLRDVLPPDARIRSPHVSDAHESVIPGSICVENYHAVLAHVRSSIRDSLIHKGTTTLVLNDEVHHVYNSVDKDLKKWKEFLLEPEFEFKYIVGMSGTCYVDNDYFADVIVRYSLNEAIEAGFVKSIDYVAEDSSGSQDEKFQKIYDNHQQNRVRYRKIKPLTILVTKDIFACKKLTDSFIGFLAKQENISSADAARKVLIVTSAKEHATSLTTLADVDSFDCPVEWITSVSMLTEGWDVKNVFQIVPHEQRAFNSKLLIAQVLGRGLRIPAEYRGERPVVTVFNHDSWSTGIKHLVQEVLEYEKRVATFPGIKDPDYNFEIHHIDYEQLEETEEYKQEKEYEFTKGYANLVSQARVLERRTEYIRAHTQESRVKSTLIHYDMIPAAVVAEQIHNRLKSIDMTTGTTSYAKKYDLAWLKAFIRASLDRIDEKEDVVSDENRQRLYSTFGVIHRQGSKVSRFRLTPQKLKKVSTLSRRRNSVGFGALRRGDCTVFWDEKSLAASDEETRVNLQEMLKDSVLQRLSVEVTNSNLFRTPLNVVITDHDPEYRFVKTLLRPENATAVDRWLKSTDQEFYEIEYSWREGDKPRTAHFNPDFFLVKGNHVFVVEIKPDEEIAKATIENKGKWRAARLHFDTLNSLQTERTYSFNFLSDENYDLFFAKLREFDGSGVFSFQSALDVALGSDG